LEDEAIVGIECVLESLQGRHGVGEGFHAFLHAWQKAVVRKAPMTRPTGN
jgi:hypothetical protein